MPNKMIKCFDERQRDSRLCLSPAMSSSSVVDVNEISIRRATFSDYENVVNMMEVYDGHDYMPTLYHVFLQSKQHVVYVAETSKDHRLVALANYRLGEDGNIVFPMSGRVHPDYQGLGITRMIADKFMQEFPGITIFAFDGLLSPGSIRRLARDEQVMGRHFHWNLIGYRITSSNLRAWSTSQTTKRSCQQSSTGPFQLTTSAVTDQLLIRVQQFMQHFSNEFFPSPHPTWCPIPLNSPHALSLLKYQLMTTNVFVTTSTEQSDPSNELSPTRQIAALSLHYPYLLKTNSYDGQVMSDVFVYCNHVNELTNHVQVQLRYLANIVGNRDIFLALVFPLNIDADQAMKSFADNSASWPIGMSTAVLNKQAYLASVDIRSQL